MSRRPPPATTLLGDSRGASLVEYLILVGLVAIVALGGIRYFGRAARAKIEAQAACIERLDCALPAEGAATLGAVAASPGRAASGVGAFAAGASSPVLGTPEAIAGRAAAAVEQAMQDGPASGARALREQLEAIGDPYARQLLAQAAAGQVRAISAEVNKNDGRPGEADLQSILRDLSIASDLSGPEGTRAIAAAFATEMVDNNLDIDDGDQFGGALKKVIREGAGHGFGLQLPQELRRIDRAGEAQEEITKAVAEALAGRPVSAEDARRQIENLTLRDEVDIGQVAIAYARTRSERPELLVDGKQAFPRILADLRAAKDSIHITQYGFKEGKIGRQVADLLIAKARAGVEVRVIVDQMGSQPHEVHIGPAKLPVGGGQKDLIADLVAGGVQVVSNDSLTVADQDGVDGRDKKRDFPDELGHLDHRKLYVIDGQVAYTGGMGLEDPFVDRQHDVMVRVKGPAVHQMQSAFLSSYMFLGGKLSRDPVTLGRYYPSLDAVQDGTATTVLQNVPKAGHHPITEVYGREIDGARQSIRIMNPYFGEDGIVDKLVAASRRGVEVTVLLPHQAEDPLNDGAQKAEYQKLTDAGVDLRGYPTMMHGKVLIADGQRVLVGTANLDKWSLHHNWEIDLHYDDPEVAAEFERRLFSRDLPRSPKLHPIRGGKVENVKRWLGDQIAG